MATTRMARRAGLAVFALAALSASPAPAADACPSLGFEGDGPASSAYARCAAFDINGTFQPGQRAQLVYTAPEGYVIRAVTVAESSETSYDDGFVAYLAVDGQTQRLRGGGRYRNLSATTIAVGLRCETPSPPAGGCGGDYFALTEFDVALQLIAAPPPASPTPQPCNRAQAQRAAQRYLEPYAARTYPRYWRRIAPRHWLTSTGWSLRRVYCRDLTGDGQAEMIAHWLGPTGGAIDPWAIFMRDADGQWTMPYAQVRDTTYELTFRGRTVVAPKVAKYDGAFTDTFRKRYVRWNGRRFVSRLGRVYEVHNPNRD